MAKPGGKNIPPERAAAGYVVGEMIDKISTQRQLFAEDVGMDAKRLSHIVNGNKKIDSDIAEKLASKLPETADYFLSLEKNVFKLRPELMELFPPLAREEAADLGSPVGVVGEVEISLKSGKREAKFKFPGDENSVHRLMDRFFSFDEDDPEAA